MKRFVAFFIVICLAYFVNPLTFANDCSNTEKKCKDPDKSFRLSSSSRSIKMRKGKKVRIVLNAYANREYFFSTYSKAKIGTLQFKIISSSNNQVLYDNSTEGLIDNKIIKMMNTKKLYLDLMIPNWKSDNIYECAGFKIAYRNIGSF